MNKECQICDGVVDLKIEKKEIIFRKENFEIFEHYYKCLNCQEEYTDENLDHINLLQLYNQYREIHNILSPEQIKDIRIKYDLSGLKMSEILGFGANMYSKYEKGEIPNQSNANLLNFIINENNFETQLIRNRNLFSQKEFERLTKRIHTLIEERKIQNYLEKIFVNAEIPNQYNGYQIPNFNKIKNIILYLTEEIKPFIVKLNKLLFYIDFYNFKKTGNSLTGIEYAAITLGPVPNNYNNLFGLLLNNKIIETVYVSFENGEGAERFSNLVSIDEGVFTENEWENIKYVVGKLGKSTTNNIKELSHQEEGWIAENTNRNLISYQKYGFFLKGIIEDEILK